MDRTARWWWRFLMFGLFGVPIIYGIIQMVQSIQDPSIIQTYASEAYTTLEEMIGSKKDGFKTVVLPFNGYKSATVAQMNKYDSIANSDERYFEDCLFEQLVISRKFKVFTRDKLDEALKEMELQMTDLFDPDTAKRVGKFVGADLIVLMDGYIGKRKLVDIEKNILSSDAAMCVNEGTFYVKILAIDVETAEVKGVWKKAEVRNLWKMIRDIF